MSQEFELSPHQPSDSKGRPRRKNMDDYADWDDEPPRSNKGAIGGIIIGVIACILISIAAVVGVVIFLFAKGVHDVHSNAQRKSAKKSAPGSRGQLGSFTLNGPDGPISFPPAEVTVVNVFLQACPDCMPSFNVYKNCGGFEADAPVVNVAYNFATKDWLKAYKMEQNLVLDKGGRMLVNPQGIRKFTTLVVDKNGKIQLRIQPTEQGYVDKVRAKIGELKSR